MGESKVVVTCQNSACSKEFIKRLAEFNRSERLGRPHFCSKSCCGKFKGLVNFGDRANKDTSYLRDIIRRDDFSPFRYHLKVMRKSAKHREQECSVILADLKLLWEKQKGICLYTIKFISHRALSCQINSNSLYSDILTQQSLLFGNCYPCDYCWCWLDPVATTDLNYAQNSNSREYCIANDICNFINLK